MLRILPSKHSTWWGRLEDVLKMSFVFIFRRRLQDVFKTTWARRIYLPYSYVFRTRLDQDQHFRLQNVFKTSSRHLAKAYSRRLQNIFKTYHEVKLFFLTRLQDVFEMYSRRFWDVLQRWLSMEGFAYVTLLRNLWSVYKTYKSDKRFSNFSFSHYFTF